jgi:hypothetical protein
VRRRGLAPSTLPLPDLSPVSGYGGRSASLSGGGSCAAACFRSHSWLILVYDVTATSGCRAMFLRSLLVMRGIKRRFDPGETCVRFGGN